MMEELGISAILEKATSTQEKCKPRDTTHEWQEWWPEYQVCRFCMSIMEADHFISAPDIVVLWAMRTLAGLGSMVAREVVQRVK